MLVLLPATHAHADDMDAQLSGEALATVVDPHLVRAGIAAERLKTEGSGESQPLDLEDNEAASSKNRHVDFHVEERTDAP